MPEREWKASTCCGTDELEVVLNAYSKERYQIYGIYLLTYNTAREDLFTVVAFIDRR